MSEAHCAIFFPLCLLTRCLYDDFSSLFLLRCSFFVIWFIAANEFVAFFYVISWENESALPFLSEWNVESHLVNFLSFFSPMLVDCGVFLFLQCFFSLIDFLIHVHIVQFTDIFGIHFVYVFIWARDDLLFIYFSGISTLITRLDALNYSTVYYMLDENIVRDLGNNCDMSEQLSAAFHKQIIFWPCPQMKVSILLQILSIWLHQIELYLHDRHRIIA